MTSKTYMRTARTLPGILIAIALFFTVLQVSPAFATNSAQGATVTMKKLSLGKANRPRVSITTDAAVMLTFGKPKSDATEEGAVQHAAGTKIYRLPKVKPGKSATWHVTAYDTQTKRKLSSKRLVWPNYKREAAKVSSAHDGAADIYAEVRPRKGGKLAVRSIFARVKVDGSVKRVKMVHAYTDENNGTRVYFLSVPDAKQVSAVVLYSVYAKLRNVSSTRVG